MFYLVATVALSVSISSNKTRIEPAGAGGATGASHQLRRHQLGRGGRWRRSRHLRRVQRPRQAGCGTKMNALGSVFRARAPFFSDYFVKLCRYLHRPAPKSGLQKVKQTDRQTTRKQTESSRYRARPWPCFGQFKRRYQSQMPPKPVPKTTLGFQLTSRLKSTSGLPRSLHSPQVAPAAQ